MSGDRIALVVFCVVTVLFVAAVWLTAPGEQPDNDRPTWHKRNHE